MDAFQRTHHLHDQNHCYESRRKNKLSGPTIAPPTHRFTRSNPSASIKYVVENGLPPHLYIFNKKDNSKILSRELSVINTSDPKSVHAQFRNCRVTEQGTYLLPYLTERHIAEFDRDWKNLGRSFEACWSAVRLKNGNTLVPGDNRAFVRELNPKGEVVWSIEKNDLPGIELRGIQPPVAWTMATPFSAIAAVTIRPIVSPSCKSSKSRRQEGRVGLRD